MRLVVTRPIEDSEKLARTLSDKGHRVFMSPVLRIVLHSDVAIPERAYQAVAITSANGSRALAGNSALTRLSRLPVFTVGAQSAEAALKTGFTNVEATGGDVDALAACILAACTPESGPILYLSGKDIAGDLEATLTQHGFEVERIVLYEAVAARALENETARTLARCEVDGVLLYSRRSARIWRTLIESSDLAETARSLPHYCLSYKAAAALAPDYVTRVPKKPDEASLLALLDRAR
jgi:uroporphyrinogen-III synthase